MIKHGAPWRGKYARALRLTPHGLQTLSSNSLVTNAWGWEHVLGARRVAGKPREIAIHVAQSPFATPDSAAAAAATAASPFKAAPASEAELAVEPSGACLAQPWEKMFSSVAEVMSDFTWPVVMRFEAADEDTATRVLMRVRRAAERGMVEV